MNKIELSEELVNAILQYLGKQPFFDVAGLINETQKQAQEFKAKPQE